LNLTSPLQSSREAADLFAPSTTTRAATAGPAAPSERRFIVLDDGKRIQNDRAWLHSV
jgi:hypothetical protein